MYPQKISGEQPVFALWLMLFGTECTAYSASKAELPFHGAPAAALTSANSADTWLYSIDLGSRKA